MANTPTPHIAANPGDFAQTVLMPGDPLRARHIAETYLTDPVLVNNVRGVQGYTGLYQGKRVSVMASGMGMPAIGIYSYELFHFFGVENIIRIGTAGSLSREIGLRGLCAAMSCFTNSTFGDQYGFSGKIPPTASYKLLRRADETAEKLGIPLHIGTFLSTDVFYECPLGPEAARLGAIACEMEAAALYVNAMQAGKHALCLCTISDNENGELTPGERQKSLTDMFRLALEIA
ncbi:MAG: purine-nucleoside phosphorylase [Clostridiales bacterium]|nr:purine-nucleoside phosphorylase [Clostridiales bacterium]MDY2835799.1 purine-nucleoside phosphorylase [Candidatus Aphodomonas sp.]